MQKLTKDYFKKFQLPNSSHVTINMNKMYEVWDNDTLTCWIGNVDDILIAAELDKRSSIVYVCKIFDNFTKYEYYAIYMYTRINYDTDCLSAKTTYDSARVLNVVLEKIGNKYCNVTVKNHDEIKIYLKLDIHPALLLSPTIYIDETYSNDPFVKIIMKYVNLRMY